MIGTFGDPQAEGSMADFPTRAAARGGRRAAPGALRPPRGELMRFRPTRPDRNAAVRSR
jgi:hypothetical protein